MSSSGRREGSESVFRSVVAVVFKNEMLFYLSSSSLPGLSGINVGADSKGLLKPVEPQIQFVTEINGPLSRERETDRRADSFFSFFFLVLFFSNAGNKNG